MCKSLKLKFCRVVQFNLQYICSLLLPLSVISRLLSCFALIKGYELLKVILKALILVSSSVSVTTYIKKMPKSVPQTNKNQVCCYHLVINSSENSTKTRFGLGRFYICAVERRRWFSMLTKNSSQQVAGSKFLDQGGDLTKHSEFLATPPVP